MEFMQTLEAAAEANEEIMLTTNLPQNGHAGDNVPLANLLELKGETFEFLKRYTWKRLGLYYFGDNWPLEISVLENLFEEFQVNKKYVKALNFCLDLIPRQVNQPPLITQKLIELFINILRNTPDSQIEELAIGINLPIPSEGLTPGPSNSLAIIMSMVSKFQNLSTFIFVTDHKVHLSESNMAWIINQLPNLKTCILCLRAGFKEQNENFAQVELGEALASRNQLKVLDLRHVFAPKPEWLQLEWKGQLNEVTIEIGGKQTRPILHLIEFCHLFRNSLTRVCLVEPPTQITQEDKGMAREMKSLESVTVYETDSSLSYLSLFSLCPRVVFLNWILEPQIAEQSTQMFSDKYFPNEERWKELQCIGIPSRNAGEDWYKIFDEYLGWYNISTALTNIFMPSSYLEAITNLNSSLYNDTPHIDL
ncbi:hypothetical protein CROQUDRAFT_671057 [Cronartium quercuum f. sp. fusiforme G11]|uniref:Uncharacterized protein n=1 Tax=Cronartium quercuum f. sp. fusiforme G11 TaxID=708437 RepID=A0A9P6TCD6_9BASI|nr:hypothetical protein CROQUDRAFT_671057 [Cronartium quercuum f. sp. fusiforme G11]